MRHPTSWLPAAVVLTGVLAVGMLVSDASSAREEDDPFSPTRSETSPIPGAPASRGPRPPKVERRLVVEVIERPPAPDKARPETPEQRIRRLLESRVRVEVTDVTLAEFARELGEQLGVPVVLNLRALEELDIGSDLALYSATPNMRAGTMLRRLLDVYELAWLVENEVLTITTKDDAGGCRVTRVYDVRDLVTVHGEDGRYDFDFVPLIDVLTNTVHYNTWQEYGGEGLIHAYEADRLQALVVTNTAEVHERIEVLLADLRAHIPDEPAGKSNPTGDVWLKESQLVKDVVPREPRVDPAEAAVRQALRKNVSVRLVDTTLGEFARHIEALLGVQVRLKMQALEEFDIGSDLYLTVEVSGVSARALLNLVLEEHELTWTIEDGRLMITTREDAQYTRYVRVYDVADLLLGTDNLGKPPVTEPAKETPAVKSPNEKHSPGDSSTPLGGFSVPDGVHGQIGGDSIPLSAGRAGRYFERGHGFDSLIELVTNSVKYDTWQEYGGEGLIEPFDKAGMHVLVVSQTREVHDAVEELFAQLRQVRREGKGLPMPKRPPSPRRPMWSDSNPGYRETEWMGHGSLGGRETRRSQSQRMRIRARPVVVEPNADRDELVVGGNRFALDLYAKLREADREANLFFSPMSVSTAMAMAQAGARGATADEIARTMHFTLPQERLHPACRSLLAASRGGAGHELAVANRLWMQKNYTFLDSFLQTTREHYGAEGERVDFADRPDEAVRRINQWTSEATRSRISEAVTRELMLPELRLVLTNAIYFKGRWLELFNARGTQSASFFTPKGEKQAPLMSRLDKLSKYAKIDDPDVEILEKDYEGSELSMLVLLPKNEPGSLNRLEAALTAENLEKWRQQLRHREVQVFLPRFRFDTGYRLEERLQAMGMKSAFGDTADFSGINGGSEPLWIEWIIHKATVEVDEEGTVARAATMGGMMGGMGSVPEPPPVFRADHPFVFLIVDNRTRSILFVGRLADPT